MIWAFDMKDRYGLGALQRSSNGLKAALNEQGSLQSNIFDTLPRRFVDSCELMTAKENSYKNGRGGTSSRENLSAAAEQHIQLSAMGML